MAELFEDAWAASTPSLASDVAVPMYGGAADDAASFWSDPVGQVIAGYSAFHDAQQRARLADLDYQTRQLAITERYRTGVASGEPLNAGGVPGKAQSTGVMAWVRDNPLMAAGLALGAVLLLRKVI